jgi:ABC-type phosphate transport system permease subunit
MNTRSIRFRLTVWFAGLLAMPLVLFGFLGYLGLSQYLRWTLKEPLGQQAKQIGGAGLG